MLSRLLSTIILFALSTNASAQEHRRLGWKWGLSAAALVAAHLVDVHSSAGRAELNPLLRNSSGAFSTRRALTIKLSVSAGLLASQALLLRKQPGSNLETPFALTNFAVASALTAVAARNYRVKPLPAYLK